VNLLLHNPILFNRSIRKILDQGKEKSSRTKEKRGVKEKGKKIWCRQFMIKLILLFNLMVGKTTLISHTKPHLKE